MMFKLLCLLILTTSSVSSNGMSDEEFVEKINQMRRQVAKLFKVPDMYELVWSQNLVKRAEDSFKNPTKDGFEVSSYGSFNEKVREYVEQDSQWWPHEKAFLTVNNVWSLYNMIAEDKALHPLQKEIGCFTLSFHFGPKLESRIKCFTAPGVQVYKPFEGAPGSKCSKGYLNDDGLCKLAPTTTPVRTTRIIAKDDFPRIPVEEHYVTISTSSAASSWSSMILIYLAIVLVQ